MAFVKAYRRILEDIMSRLGATFSAGSQEVSGTTILQLYDENDRLLFTVDQDALVGGRFWLPIQLVDGSLPLSVLNSVAQQTLPFSLGNEVDGYAVRFNNADETRTFGGIPTSYPVEPMDVVGLRARYHDAFAGATNATYLLYGKFDSNGQQQLYTRKIKTGEKAQLTTGHAMAPRIDGSNALWVDGAAYRSMYRPLDGSDIARRVHHDTTYTVVGDSTGQSLAQGLTGSVNGGMANNGREVISISAGSQTTRQVAARFGVPNLINVTITGGSVPASGAVACTLDYDFVVGVSPTVIGGARAQFTTDNGTIIQGTFVRASNGSFTFTRTTSGSVLACAGAKPIQITGDYVTGQADTTAALAAALVAPPNDRLRGNVVIIRLERNDLGPTSGKAYNAANTLDIIKALVAYTTPLYKAVIVMGVMQTYGQIPVANGGLYNSTTGAGGTVYGSVELASKSLLDNDLVANAALKAEFGAAYFDTMQGHKDAGYTSTVTLGGTTYDYVTNTAIADGTHENATGYNSTATKVLTFANALEF